MSLLWPLFLRYSRPHLKAVVALVLLALVGVALEALLPWPLKIVIDHVLPGRPLPDVLQMFASSSPAATLAWCASAILLLFLAHHGVVFDYLNGLADGGDAEDAEVLGTGAVELFNDSPAAQRLGRIRFTGRARVMLEEFRVSWGQPDYGDG